MSDWCVLLDTGNLIVPYGPMDAGTAADRVRRACEAVHNGSPGEPAHHGRTRWDFS